MKVHVPIPDRKSSAYIYVQFNLELCLAMEVKRSPERKFLRSLRLINSHIKFSYRVMTSSAVMWYDNH